MTKRPQQQPQKAPCLSCRHYFVTWDPGRPYGCRAFGFKSSTMPCREVQGASNMICLKYEEKPDPKRPR
ncbi:uracil-DNA glycosylase [Mariprofundus erugo]|uniref:Uracil-DNA glycosylase n=1 Tax=Mariprofundus erugo TaxID=2528639 RepID=A0A5R9GQS6_9PROT|nr:uracil-DNA glycosylase [Mariprofundus erugo]TLS77671.1 uracil-DNA glycosylase [Mariprofundus erugo]